jgi:nucleotide-binding universal stress UspA family protein
MQAPHTIVVGLDCSAPLVAVFEEACLLARTFGAKLIPVHAVPLLAPANEFASDQMKDTLKDLSHHPAAKDLDLEEPCVRFGEAADVLLAVAEEKHANWIVLGAGHKSRLDAWLLGSVAEVLVRRSALPVWLVRPGSPRKDLKRIVTAVDDSEAGREALKGGAFLARTFVSQLTLLTVGTPKRCAAALDEARYEVDLHGIDLSTVSRRGEAADGIVEELEEHPADLLILGCAGREGLARLWHRNTAERLARRAPCSVLSLHAPSQERTE